MARRDSTESLGIEQRHHNAIRQYYLGGASCVRVSAPPTSFFMPIPSAKKRRRWEVSHLRRWGAGDEEEEQKCYQALFRPYQAVSLPNRYIIGGSPTYTVLPCVAEIGRRLAVGSE